jgi:hypothetical protein
VKPLEHDSNLGVRYVALYFTGIVALMGMFVFVWCAMWKIYIDVPMLLVLSNVTIAAVSSFTTLLTGRTVSQLNQQSDVKNIPQISNGGQSTV